MDFDSYRRIANHAGKAGQHYWRSLAELVDPTHAPTGEFAVGADLPPADMSRRTWLELLTATLALAGLSSCSREERRKMMPYTIQPQGVTPGVARHYATSMVIDGYAVGLHVETHEGRPTKIEGNPAHPSSLGAAGILEQAHVLSVYDPHRTRAIRSTHGLATWDGFAAEFGRPRADKGYGLRFLMDAQSSPLVSDLMKRVKAHSPGAEFAFHNARGAHATDAGRLLFGRPVQPMYDLRKATRILSLDADFAATMPSCLTWARQLADGRRVPGPGAPMNRLYSVEGVASLTGTMADHRLRRAPSEIPRLTLQIAAAILLAKRPAWVTPDLGDLLARAQPIERDRTFIQALVKDLLDAGPASLVVVGDRQPPVVHALAQLIHRALGSEATWNIYPVVLPGDMDLRALAAQIQSGGVDTLVILGGNPSYTAPADLEFPRLTRSVAKTAYVSLYDNETADDVQWVIPALHQLESWGDARAYDGTMSFLQPLISPLVAGKDFVEVLDLFAGQAGRDAHELLHDLWTKAWAAAGVPADSAAWEQAVRAGFIPNTAYPALALELAPSGLAELLLPLVADRGASSQEDLELVYTLDTKVYDGRFSNNAWLQELPDPLTKLTWDNAVLISPATAARLGVHDEDVVVLGLDGRTVEGPVLVAPGQADGCVVVALGYGRKGAERVAEGVGFDASRLRTAREPWVAHRVTVTKTPRRHELARTQQHWHMHGRPIVLSATAEQYRSDPLFARENKGAPPSLLDPVASHGQQWAMGIDLGVCTGCSACVLACQAENNGLLVGKESVAKGREMHWLRIDTYYEGTSEEPLALHQPMMCQHCEKAPCEVVCPVNATVHSPDGLNEMVYNRCVGTRFCSNNCPYKVRRFNYLDFIAEQPENQGLVELQRNPNVTVRDRGVMEKCTYCVQRIRTVEIHARVEGRDLRTGEIQTACQQACPTRAITFGSLAQADAEVVRWRTQPRSYSVLHETGALPRTQYLARIRNPNPELP
jgi:molybdopterin-containing oxidoreductase family iron-sulfur binding subunit